MRKIEFEVPTEVIGDFTQKLTETGLDNRVTGRTDDDEIEIEVYYEKENAEVIDELEEYLEELTQSLYEEETEEEEEAEEDED